MKRGAHLYWKVLIIAWTVLAATPSLVFPGEDAGVGSPDEVETVCVMYFHNRAPGRMDWLSRGLADLLITDLARAERLQVVDRERLKVFLKEMNLSAMGMVEPSTMVKLGNLASVEKVLFGSFLVSGGRLEIEAHVVEVATGSLQKIEWVRGDVDDIFALEKELAFKIINNLRIELTEAEKKRIRHRPTDSIDALTRYYTAVDLSESGRYREALLEARLALRKDENYSQARIMTGHLYQSMGEFGHALVEYSRAVVGKTEDELADNALFAMARIYQNMLNDYPRAIELYRRLIELYPEGRIAGQTWGYGGYLNLADSISIEICDLYLRLGRLEEAYRIYYALLERHPDSNLPDTIVHLKRVRMAFVDLITRIYTEKSEVLRPPRNSVVFDPANPVYGDDYTTEKRFDDAYTITRHTPRPEDYDPLVHELHLNGKITPHQSFETDGRWVEYSRDGTPEGSFICNGAKDSYLFYAPEGYQIDKLYLEIEFEGKVFVGCLNMYGKNRCGRFLEEADSKKFLVRAYPVEPPTPFVKLDVIAHEAPPGKVYRWRLRASLSPQEKAGSLRIVSKPSGAEVFLDWKKPSLGKTPLDVAGLAPGRYRVHLEPPHGNREIYFKDREIDVRAGSLETVSFTAEDRTGGPRPPLSPKIVLSHMIDKLRILQDLDGTYHLVVPRSASTIATRKIEILHASSPDGFTWSVPELIPAPINSPESDTEPLFAMQSDGKFRLQWLSRRSGSARSMVAWTRDMDHWSDPIQVKKPVMASLILQRRSGRWIALSSRSGPTRNQIRGTGYVVAAFSEDGVTWTDWKTVLELEGEQQVSEMHLIEDQRGRLRLIYTMSEVTRKSLNPDGKGFRTWNRGSIHLATSEDGSLWESRRILPDPGEEKGRILTFGSPFLLQEPEGRFVFCFFSPTTRVNSTPGIYIVLSDDGERWSPPHKLPIKAVVNKQIALFRDRDGSYRLFWIGMRWQELGAARIASFDDYLSEPGETGLAKEQ